MIAKYMTAAVLGAIGFGIGAAILNAPIGAMYLAIPLGGCAGAFIWKGIAT